MWSLLCSQGGGLNMRFVQRYNHGAHLALLLISKSRVHKKVTRDPSNPSLCDCTSHTTYATQSVYSFLICHHGSKISITCFLWFITHSQHDIWDWFNDLVLSWLISVNSLLLLCLDSKLISKAHFTQPMKVNIAPSHIYPPVFQSRYVCFSAITSRCNL